MQAAANVIFTNMYAKKGIKLFGEKAISAMIKKFKQLYEGAMSVNLVVIPSDTDELTDIERRKAIESMNLTKEK